MATLEQLEQALRAADAAGNVEDARRLAQAYAQARAQQKPDFSNVQGGVTQAPPAQPSFLEREARGLGLGARSVLQGAGSLLGAIGGDAFNMLLPGEQPSYRDAAGALADKIGLPRPENARERVLGDVGEALTGTGLTMGAGAGLNALAQAGSRMIAPVTNRLGQFLTAQPKLQAASAATGAGAAGVTREQGGSQGQQLAAGLVGGLSPGVAGAATGATVRGLVRGRDGAQMQRTIEDFAALGATPSVGQASGNRLVQGAENLLAGGPTSAGVMHRFAERQASDIGEGLKRTAEGLSRNASGERAGRSIQRGIHGPDGFTAQFKRTQGELFDRLDQFIPAQQRIGVTNTQMALGQLNAPIPGAPNTSKLFQNARVQGIGRALEADLNLPTDAQNQLDDALATIDRLYASRDGAAQEMGRFAAFANDQANRANRWYPVAGAPRAPGRYSHFPERAAEATSAARDAGALASGHLSRAKEIEASLEKLQAAADATNGRLPYEAIKKLRTLVGQEIQDSGLMSDFPRSKFKSLYAALTKDLEAAAGEAGPGAAQAFRRANNYTRAGMDRVEMIERVVDKNGGPEAVFQAAMSGTKDGGTVLRSVMQSLPRDGQRAVTAAVLKRMGMATPGAQDASGDVFSAATFLTNWNRVSPEAKRALFDRHGPGFSRDMDRIARVAANIKDGAKVFANPSGTANRAAAMTYGASLVGSMFAGGTGYLAAGGLGANVLARLMTNPRVVRVLANTTAMPVGAIPGTVNALREIGRSEDDPDVIALADYLAAQEPNGQLEQSP